MNQKYMNEELDNLEEEVWDRFTSLKEEEMADMAERAISHFFVFKIKDFDESIKNAAWALSEGYKTLVEMVEDGVNGFLFDPTSIDSMVSCFKKFFSKSRESIIKMGMHSRMKAEKLFDKDNFINAYIKLIEF